MFYHLLIAVAGIFLMMGAWLGLQLLERRQTSCANQNGDLLKHRMGCLGCMLKGHCHTTGEG